MKNIKGALGVRVAPLLPNAIRSRLVPAENNWSRRDLSTPAVPGDGEIRLLIAPNNYAGQAYQWAQAANTLPGVSAVNLVRTVPGTGFSHLADFEVKDNVARRSSIWANRQGRAMADQFTHVLLEGARLPYQGDGLGTTEDYVRAWQEQGLKVGLLWHGSDIRLPRMHLELEPHSPFHNYDRAYRHREATASRNTEVANSLGIDEFVSTLDLLKYRPDATWLPRVVDSKRWDAPGTNWDGRIPTVLHIPSNPTLKGTESIRSVMSRIEREGIATYKEVQNVPARDMPCLVADSDIVIDQLNMGLYGVASIEAMLSRKMAIAHVWDSTRESLVERTGFHLPVVEADPNSLYTVVKRIVQDPDAALRRGEDGRSFALGVHSLNAAATALAPFLGVRY